jgi:hypothetical protein
MKQCLFLVIILCLSVTSLTGQDLVYPNRPVAMLKSSRGFIVMAEYHAGAGVGDVTVPYSKQFNGFNILAGYQLNKSFIIAAGSGAASYNGGTLVPVYMDLRYTFYFSRLAPYLFADGGLLMNVSNFNETRMFMNPGIGARYSVTRNIALNFSAGILAQSSGTTMNVFANIRTGVIYKF